MRSLTLARALAARGARCRFMAGPSAVATLEVFGRDIERLATGSDQPAALAGAATAASAEAEVVVFDHYRLGAEAERGVRPARVVVLDDLADRGHDCDLLIDPSLAREPEAYRDIAPGARLLAGPAYALVRDEFVALRPAALARRMAARPVRRALIAMGLTDVGETTCRVVQGLLNDFGPVEVDVVLGIAAPTLGEVERMVARDGRLHLHVDTPRMAELMAAADIAIGAGGSSVWERACLGLPSIAVVLAENQRAPVLALAERGGCLPLDRHVLAFEAMLSAEWYGLLSSPETRRRMTQVSAALCDGLGAGRVADAVLALLA